MKTIFLVISTIVVALAIVGFSKTAWEQCREQNSSLYCTKVLTR